MHRQSILGLVKPKPSPTLCSNPSFFREASGTQMCTNQSPKRLMSKFTQMCTNQLPKRPISNFTQMYTNQLPKRPISNFTQMYTNQLPKRPISNFKKKTYSRRESHAVIRQLDCHKSDVRHRPTCESVRLLQTRIRLLMRTFQASQSRRSHTGTSGDIENSDGALEQPPSWLFVSGAVAGKYGAQVNVELDLDDQLEGRRLVEMRENLKTRGLTFHLEELVKESEELKEKKLYKTMLLSKREQVIQELQALKNEIQDKKVQAQIDSLVCELKTVKKQLSELKPHWDLETKVVLSALRLPNSLHPSTPTHETSVLNEKISDTELKEPVLSHIELAQRFDLIKFRNVGPKAYYLKKDLALAEMSLADTTVHFLQSKQFRAISGPEFVKSPIIEGLGKDLSDHQQLLTLIDPHQDSVEPMDHLTGVAASTFAAFVAKTCIGDSRLPLNLFSCGRRYQKGCGLPGLFDSVQRTQAHVFSCVAEGQVEDQFQHCVDIMWEFVQTFGFTVRLASIPARDLDRAERRRVEIQIWVPSLNSYITVSSLSDYGDFVSRRLMTSHNRNHADIRSARFLHMIHGCALDITRLLAVWMEYSQSDSTFFRLCKLPVQNQ